MQSHLTSGIKALLEGLAGQSVYISQARPADDLRFGMSVRYLG